MTQILRNLAAGLASAAVLLLAACGGGGDGGGGGNTATPPTAVATAAPASAPIGTVVTLDASASTTPNGGTLSYEWTLSAKPEGSAAALSSATAAKPTLTVDLPGEYVADLIVKDGAASASARVTVTATNPDPVAVVVPLEQTVLQGETVTLDGSKSLPPTGGAASELRYQWNLIDQPDGDLTTPLDNAASAQASFLAERVGVYRATLVVRHGDKVSAPVEVKITVNTGNSYPVISIVEPEGATHNASGHLLFNATLRKTIVLDGSGTKDPDGDVLSYRWRFALDVPTPKPDGSEAVISGTSSAKAEFTPDIVGKYYLDFLAYDGHASTTQRVVITVAKAAGDTVNTAPGATIGFATTTDQCELGGSGTWWPYCTVYAYAYDAEGDPLTYNWTYWKAGSEDRQTSADASLKLDGNDAGDWRVELVVNDGKLDSAVAAKTLTIKIAANRAPVAKVALDVAKVEKGGTLVFDGSGSTDADGDQMFYTWTLVDRPDGSAAVVDGKESDPIARVTTDKAGVYTVHLQVKDARGGYSPATDTTASASGFAKVSNHAPVLSELRLEGGTTTVAGRLNSNITPGQAVVVNDDGLHNFSLHLYPIVLDPDQDTPLYYDISVTQPQGSTIKPVSCTIPVTTANRCSFVSTPNPFVPGDYAFEAIASDGLAYSETKRLEISAVSRQNYPTLLLEQNPKGDPAAGTSATQKFFPFTAVPASTLDGSSWTYTLNSLGDSGRSDDYQAIYQLTAFDRDYTIVDLATSAVDGYQPSFVGLQNNQVIRKGESVLFYLRRPRIPNEAQLYAEALEKYPNLGSIPKAERESLHNLIATYQFKWSFRVSEKDGYTFHVGPLN
ncbi:PKD domain protein [Pigmentiphaga humi]|uniref:PKD domain protein n=1 Tax=Pigmentiphaga humi TaxID=2478468 RepID=A0A3P4AYN5_9BURK|nr:PKD domain-containing protein [Pigmentiphaga humi]VCU69153.1 PKD domain protein [Pigmentiphaga humi]